MCRRQGLEWLPAEGRACTEVCPEGTATPHCAMPDGWDEWKAGMLSADDASVCIAASGQYNPMSGSLEGNVTCACATNAVGWIPASDVDGATGCPPGARLDEIVCRAQGLSTVRAWGRARRCCLPFMGVRAGAACPAAQRCSAALYSLGFFRPHADVLRLGGPL